jgi:hypothetical protein
VSLEEVDGKRSTDDKFSSEIGKLEKKESF